MDRLATNHVKSSFKQCLKEYSNLYSNASEKARYAVIRGGQNKGFYARGKQPQ